MRGDGLSADARDGSPAERGEGSLAGAARRADETQQRHAVLAFPLAVVRKFSEDRGGNLAAMLAYFGFFSLFPLLAVATTILSRVLADDPQLQRQLLDTALRNVPLIGGRIATDLRALDAGGVGLAIAIALSLWSGLGAVKAFEDAMNTVWNVPERHRPGFVHANLRAFAMLIGLALLTALSAAVTLTGLFGGGWAGEVVRVLLGVAVHVALFLVAYTVLAAAQVRWTAHLPGAIVAAVAWTILLRIGGTIVARQIAQANDVYGTFALVVGLLAWIYLGASLALLAAEVNVVRHARLWPRTIVPPPLGEADERALTRYAKQAERRPEIQVEVRETGSSAER